MLHTALPLLLTRIFLFVIIIILFTFLSRAAAFGPLGDEFLVNTETTNGQALSSIAMNDNGDFVITWQHQVSGNNWDINAQLYDSSGDTVGGEFLVNTTTSLAQQ